MGKLEPDCQVQVPPPSCVTLGKSLNLSGLQRPPSGPTPEGEGKTDTCKRPGTCRVRVSVAVTLVATAGPKLTMVDSSISRVRRLKPRVGNDLPKVSRVFYKPNQALCWSFSVRFPDQPITWKLVIRVSSPNQTSVSS